MSGIKDYSTTPGSNTALFPENMNPSAVNDNMRQVQADIRSWYEDAQWTNWGDTPSRAAASEFKITGDVTTRYTVNRRIKCSDAATLYGTITASTYSNPDTTVTVELDTGSLTASLTAVSLAILTPDNQSIPKKLSALEIEGASTFSGASVFKTTANVQGALKADDTLTASGAAVFKTTLTVEGASTFSGTSVFKTEAIFGGNATQSGRVYFLEDSDNGTNKITMAAPAAITADRTISLPDTDIANFVVQRVSTQTGAVATGTTIIPDDDTIPQNNEGNEFMTLAITPKNSSNILVFDIVLKIGSNTAGNNNMTAALFQDSTANALAAINWRNTVSNGGNSSFFRHTMTAGTTSATTFKIRAGGAAAGTTTFNGEGSSRQLGGVMASSITITEYAA